MSERIVSMSIGAAAVARKQEPELSTSASQQLAISKFATGEQMLRIATRLLMSLTQEEKLVACTGISQQDPSGEFAMHLALAVARLGHGPVLLVDANFRSRAITTATGGTASKGLADVLAAEQFDASAAQSTDVPALHLLPSGLTTDVNPSSLTSPRMAKMLDVFRIFRLTIMDIGPVVANAESLLMASKADVLVATATSGERSRSDLERFRSETKMLPPRLLGVVLTESK